eukprot:2589646-Pyramimonas_sp.AAC.1
MVCVRRASVRATPRACRRLRRKGRLSRSIQLDGLAKRRLVEHIPGVGTNQRGLESIFQGPDPITGDTREHIPGAGPKSTKYRLLVDAYPISTICRCVHPQEDLYFSISMPPCCLNIDAQMSFSYSGQCVHCNV